MPGLLTFAASTRRSLAVEPRRRPRRARERPRAPHCAHKSARARHHQKGPWAFGRHAPRRRTHLQAIARRARRARGSSAVRARADAARRASRRRRRRPQRAAAELRAEFAPSAPPPARRHPHCSRCLHRLRRPPSLSLGQHVRGGRAGRGRARPQRGPRAETCSSQRARHAGRRRRSRRRRRGAHARRRRSGRRGRAPRARARREEDARASAELVAAPQREPRGPSRRSAARRTRRRPSAARGGRGRRAMYGHFTAARAPPQSSLGRRSRERLAARRRRRASSSGARPTAVAEQKATVPALSGGARRSSAARDRTACGAHPLLLRLQPVAFATPFANALAEQRVAVGRAYRACPARGRDFCRRERLAQHRLRLEAAAVGARRRRGPQRRRGGAPPSEELSSACARAVNQVEAEAVGPRRRRAVGERDRARVDRDAALRLQTLVESTPSSPAASRSAPPRAARPTALALPWSTCAMMQTLRTASPPPPSASADASSSSTADRRLLRRRLLHRRLLHLRLELLLHQLELLLHHRLDRRRILRQVGGHFSFAQRLRHLALEAPRRVRRVEVLRASRAPVFVNGAARHARPPPSGSVHVALRPDFGPLDGWQLRLAADHLAQLVELDFPLRLHHQLAAVQRRLVRSVAVVGVRGRSP